ncbi:MAG: YdeI/OmpD-associated family protein [Polyangiales bacterium]
MPASVRRALTERGVLAEYRARPAYQQNDYLGWIARAKREATQEKRLQQMLDELAQGDVYMNMAWRAK